MSLKIGKKHQVETLSVDLSQAGLMILRGTLSTPTAQAEFRQMLVHLHTQIVAMQVRKFQADLRAVHFVNSSAIRAFVDWISHAAVADYKLVFITNPSVTWQRLSFLVLKSLAPETVELSEELQSISVVRRNAP